ncbi:hypothetical protein AAF712_011082 [Marasmius tenuissimus]|uniref:BTB domain-containing protein n=1 Tax=Marasmius tenuissimus TaxID=585030 RepID=A0ABR2ZNW9_9AGAR|nr:hypothetical protein PM082_024634 [Marasmius tenuissimus]
MTSPIESKASDTSDSKCPVEGCSLPLDITLRASDGILFGAHQKNLECFSEAFPRKGWTTEKKDEVVDLSEPGAILSLLLRFMHNHPLPNLKQECKEWSVDDLLALIKASEKYGILVALQVTTKALKSKAKVMNDDDLLKVLLHKAIRSDATDIEEFARRTLRISEKEVLMKFKSHTDVFWAWNCYRLEWQAWKNKYWEAFQRKQYSNTHGTARYGWSDCADFFAYFNNIEPLTRKFGDDFPTLEHFNQAENILNALPGAKQCNSCDNFGRWRTNAKTAFSSQPRWVECMNQLTQ